MAWQVDKDFNPNAPEPEPPQVPRDSIGGGGWKPDESFKPEARAKIGTGEDIARGVGSGIAMAPADLLGMPGDVAKFAREKGGQGLVDAFMSMIPGYGLYRNFIQPKIDPENKLPTALPTSDVIKEGIPGYKSFDYTPETHSGEISKRVGGFVGGAALAPWRTGAQLAANIGRFGLAPAAGSEIAGESAHQFYPGFEPAARLVGGLYGSAKATKFISPNASTAPAATRAQYAEHAANVENELGLKLTPGEKSNSILARIKEDEANPDRYLHNREAITERATKAVAPEYATPVLQMPKVDAAGNVIEQGTLGKMRSGIGKKFEEVTSNPQNHLEFDQQNGPIAAKSIVDLQNKYEYAAGYDKDAVAAIRNAAAHVSATLSQNGPSARTNLPHLTAPQYQTMRSSLMDAAMGAEGQKKQALHDFIDVLDNSFDRSLKTYNPGDLGKIQEARKQWRAMLTVEKAAGRGDVDHLSSGALESAAQSSYGKSAHLRGLDPFWWAPSAKAVLKTEANSNTARREEARKSLEDLIGSVAGPIGFALGHHIGGGSENGVAGLLMGEKFAPVAARQLHPVLDRVSGTPLFQAYSGNQVLAGQKGLLSPQGPITGAIALRPPEYEDAERKRPRLSLTVGPNQ